MCISPFLQNESNSTPLPAPSMAFFTCCHLTVYSRVRYTFSYCLLDSPSCSLTVFPTSLNLLFQGFTQITFTGHLLHALPRETNIKTLVEALTVWWGFEHVNSQHTKLWKGYAGEYTNPNPEVRDLSLIKNKQNLADKKKSLWEGHFSTIKRK